MGRGQISGWLWLGVLIVLILSGCQTIPAQPQDLSPLQNQEFLLAEKYFLEGNYQEAITYYQRFLTTHPHSPFQAEIYYRLGVCHLTQDKYDLALSLFQEALNQAKDVVLKGMIQMKIATTFMYKKNYPAAIQWYKKALASNSKSLPHDELLYYLAIAYIRTGEWKKGYEYLHQLIRLVPVSPYSEGARTILALPPKTYVIQLGKYHHKEYALKALESFRHDKGIDATLEVLHIEGKEVYFIWAGKFSDWRSAMTKLDEIMNLGVEAIILP